ncbi:MAG: hypothetical protein RSD26_11885 [Cellulosilyticaceae bacterium]
MSPVSQQIVELVDMLPEEEQNLAYEFIKRMVLAWDADFTKITPIEKIRIVETQKLMEQGEVFGDSDINWD